MENKLQPANATLSRNFNVKQLLVGWAFFSFWYLEWRGIIKTTSLNGFKDTKVAILQVLHEEL